MTASRRVQSARVHAPGAWSAVLLTAKVLAPADAGTASSVRVATAAIVPLLMGRLSTSGAAVSMRPTPTELDRLLEQLGGVPTVRPAATSSAAARRRAPRARRRRAPARPR